MVRLVVNFFVVMTSLLLGLMMNSAKNTLETNNRNIRTPAIELILLDRTMRALGRKMQFCGHSITLSNFLRRAANVSAALDSATRLANFIEKLGEPPPLCAATY